MMITRSAYLRKHLLQDEVVSRFNVEQVALLRILGEIDCMLPDL